MKKSILIMLSLALAAPAWSAWDFSKSRIDPDLIRSGGPPKDGIPALFDPQYIPAVRADELLDDGERVLGFTQGGEARAYPIRILSWHELVNDTVTGSPILVSW